ncbi:MAG: VTT domain-containing protein [Alphaproteobacteria bacterium]|nr:VTT domain-containing protein [Alphaproteobacteria bacterium]MCL2890122.1 VTT domain-containing protein [Alphaproteobacteria bacterium]
MKLQHYILKQCDKPAALWVIFWLTVCESIFLFLPPEVFMTPTIVANKKKALPVVIVTSLGSLVGGIIAYMIGFWLFESIGTWLITTFSSMENFEIARSLFAKHGLFIIFLAAFTPVPYKLLAICAGFLTFNPILFIGVTAIFRTLRFAILGALLWRFQEQANTIVKKYFWPLTLLAVVAAGFGIIMMTWL